MLTSAASALVCADPPAESAIPVVIELSVLAVKVLATAAASTSASTMPPSGGNAAPANCCVPVARFTTAAYPCPLTYGVCAARAAVDMRPLIAPIATSPHNHCGTPLVTMLLMVGCPPRQRLSSRQGAGTVGRRNFGAALVQLDVAAGQSSLTSVALEGEAHGVAAAARLPEVTRFREKAAASVVANRPGIHFMTSCVRMRSVSLRCSVSPDLVPSTNRTERGRRAPPNSVAGVQCTCRATLRYTSGIWRCTNAARPPGAGRA